MICSYCGSHKVWVEAKAEWSPEHHQWVLTQIFEEQQWCSDCDAETIIIPEETEKLNYPRRIS